MTALSWFRHRHDMLLAETTRPKCSLIYHVACAPTCSTDIYNRKIYRELCLAPFTKPMPCTNVKQGYLYRPMYLVLSTELYWRVRYQVQVLILHVELNGWFGSESWLLQCRQYQ